MLLYFRLLLVSLPARRVREKLLGYTKAKNSFARNHSECVRVYFMCQVGIHLGCGYREQ